VAKRLVLVGDKEAEFIEQAIEAWTVVYQGDRVGFERFQFERAEVQRKLEGKYTEADHEER
jgi:hypothetical protein